MAANIDEAFGTLADTDLWEEAAATLAGFLAPTLVRNIAEGRTDFDIPDEVYGIAIVGASPYSPAYSGSIALGGGLYTLDTAMERFGVKQTVSGANL